LALSENLFGRGFSRSYAEKAKKEGFLRVFPCNSVSNLPLPVIDDAFSRQAVEISGWKRECYFFSVPKRRSQMNTKPDTAVWSKKNSTLSHKTAEKEFGLTFDEIVEAINAGKLQYREANIYGAPFLRLIRSEVEALVSEKYGADYLQQKQYKKELAEVNKTLIALNDQTLALQKRKTELLELLSKK
jgi:hypothetical protein